MALWQALGALAIAVYGGIVLVTLARLPSSRVRGPLAGVILAGTLWATGDLLTSFERDLLWEQIGVAILYTGSIYVAPLWWMLVVRWAEGHGARLPFDTDRWTAFPMLWATAMWLVMLTNPWHGQFLTPVIGDRNVYQPLWWLVSIPNYALNLAGVCVVLGASARLPLPSVRRQAVLIVAASGVTLVANWIYVFGPERTLNGTLLVLAVAGSLLLVGMYREGLFGLLPVALPVLAQRDPDGLVIVRPGGRIAFSNPRARSLLDPVALGESVRLPEALGSYLRDPDGKWIESEDGWEGLWWSAVLRPGGALYRFGSDGARWLQTTAHAARSRSGRIAALCLRIRDVTEERQMELELGRARRLESVAGLARGIAHDFRNLLAVVRGNAELIVTDPGAAAATEHRADRILQSAAQAIELAEQLQLYAGGVDPVRRPVDLSEVARNVWNLVQPQLDERVEVQLEVAPEPLVVEADRTQLHQALLNLCVNANEAVRECGGDVQLATGRTWLDPSRMRSLVLGRDQAPGYFAWVKVADTGPGMDAQTQERIFEPFFSTKGKRRGIGLSTVLGVARANDALVELRVRAGAGSAFTLYFAMV